MTPPKVDRGFRLTGRVQGVGFRWWTRSLAEDLGITGTVRNCPDGTVEVHARGEPSEMESFSARLREGPPHAHVENIRTTEANLPSEEAAFRIIR